MIPLSENIFGIRYSRHQPGYNKVGAVAGRPSWGIGRTAEPLNSPAIH